MWAPGPKSIFTITPSCTDCSSFMPRERLTAFSDGVIAIIITIMVLELKVPHGDDWPALLGLWPIFLSYVLSFIYIAIYWNNHHHLLFACDRVNGAILWANMHLLFWLSLIPFATGWLGENEFAKLPAAVYGASLLMPAIAWKILQRAILASEGGQSLLAKALSSDLKGTASPLLYACAIAIAFIAPWISCAIYAGVAVLWLIPDRRIEDAIGRSRREP
jgi:TMEM175 potassium channel family protein